MARVPSPNPPGGVGPGRKETAGGPREEGEVVQIFRRGVAALRAQLQDGDKETQQEQCYSLCPRRKWVSLLPSDLTSQNPQETRGSTAATGPSGQPCRHRESGNGEDKEYSGA